MQLVVLTQKEKYWWIEMFEMNDIVIKKTQNKQQWYNHLLSIEKNITQLLNSCIYIYIICDIFFLIKCNYDVIHLFIFVMYDVQYVANAYGFKINWISIFVNHKWIAHVLNALVFLFLRILFKNMHGFVNLLLKLSIYVFSSRFKKLEN